MDEPPVDVEIPSLEPGQVADAGAPDAAPPVPGREDVGGGSPEPAPLGQAVLACLELVVDCRTIQVAVSDAAEDVCVHMTIDDCGSASRTGLPVDVPVSWRLSSASIADLADGCVPGTYDASNVIIVDGSGSIGWNLETPRPSDVAIDVTLIPSATAVGAAPVDIAGAVGGSLLDCDD